MEVEWRVASRAEERMVREKGRTCGLEGKMDLLYHQ
jgi:hypothetical protein